MMRILFLMGVLLSNMAFADVVSLHRFFNGMESDHLYTANTNEAFYSASNAGYVYEGPMGRCLSSPELDTIPLYRLYQPAARTHFYTASAQEREELMLRDRYVNEGIVCYVYASYQTNLCPLYRLSRGRRGDNLLTTYWDEVVSSERSSSYTYDGAQGYVLPNEGEKCP